ncbi:histidine kinase [Natronolimnobius sp. AArcel1]|uniref:sensor domain-containing protein n=1 Tax=Natronolimnobius sp. AArcel1 TaxID=1679093 RepID=UPI0013EDBC2A|nr:sensor domain-containing protein [Natronolimnobius sp. AArcel1]NGM69596.1 histidine kinase [Natronolimnobius sp. AArcel1]
MESSEHATRDSRWRGSSLLGVVTAKQTYTNLVYLFLAIPLAFAYSAVFMFGLVFGTFLILFIVGIPIVIATILSSRLLAAFERALANALLAVDLEAPNDVQRGDGDGFVSSLRRYLVAGSTWRGLGFLFLKIGLGFVSFIGLFLFATALSLVQSPVHYPTETEFVTVNDQPITWAIDTVPELGLAVVLGVVLLLVCFHLVNALAALTGRIALSLLDGPTEPVPSPGTESLPTAGSDDGDGGDNADSSETPRSDSAEHDGDS